MRKSFVAFFAVLAFIACLTFSRKLSLSQDLGQVHEICSPHEGRCLTIRPPKVPAVPTGKCLAHATVSLILRVSMPEPDSTTRLGPTIRTRRSSGALTVRSCLQPSLAVMPSYFGPLREI